MRASEQGGEGKTSPAGPGSEGLGRIIDEVKCASCLWQKPILFLRGGVGDRSVAMLFEEVSCSWEKEKKERQGSGVASHLRSGREKRGELLRGATFH